MQTLLKHWTHALLGWLGVTSTSSDALDRWVAFVLVLLAALILDLFLQLAVVRGIRRLVERTRVKWDDKLFSVPVLNRSCHVLMAIVLSVVLPVIFDEQTTARIVVVRLTQILIVVTFLRLINALLCAAFHIVSLRPDWQNKPIKGLRQTAQGFFTIVAVILIVAILIDKSPVKLLTGLGASAAVLMLVFRDSIMGFVSGIQLSANNMLQVGDWISVPKFGADGTVEEVSLTTVKIRNWDNTLAMLPPYLLTTDSFTNWHAMQLSGGRRVMRSVSIDMTSVHFCTPEMLARFRQIDLLRDYIDLTERRIESYNAAHGIAPGARKINGLHQTNLGVFRAYLVRYLEAEVPVNKSMTLMVRQLQPTETGIPIQLYFFTDTVVWTEYEGIQSDVFDHVLAVIPEFGLRVFQSPAGSDVAALGDFLQGDDSQDSSPRPDPSPESEISPTPAPSMESESSPSSPEPEASQTQASSKESGPSPTSATSGRSGMAGAGGPASGSKA